METTHKSQTTSCDRARLFLRNNGIRNCGLASNKIGIGLGSGIINRDSGVVDGQNGQDRNRDRGRSRGRSRSRSMNTLLAREYLNTEPLSLDDEEREFQAEGASQQTTEANNEPGIHFVFFSISERT